MRFHHKSGASGGFGHKIIIYCCPDPTPAAAAAWRPPTMPSFSVRPKSSYFLCFWITRCFPSLINPKLVVVVYSVDCCSHYGMWLRIIINVISPLGRGIGRGCGRGVWWRRGVATGNNRNRMRQTDAQDKYLDEAFVRQQNGRTDGGEHQ